MIIIATYTLIGTAIAAKVENSPSGLILSDSFFVANNIAQIVKKNIGEAMYGVINWESNAIYMFGSIYGEYRK